MMQRITLATIVLVAFGNVAAPAQTVPQAESGAPAAFEYFDDFTSPLPQGGSLELLGAYYMPDPKPPADSHNVEGLLKPGQGKIFVPLQRLYKEHADFGGLRVLLRNNSKVPVRISPTVLFDGKPIEESYVDFLDGSWDDRGVVWYRVRPRSLTPGQCAELFIRFRRRPAGASATLTVSLQNGKPLQVKVPYQDLPLRVDYVTTGKDPDTLYVYARQLTKARIGRLRTVMLDGVVLKNVKIYGADFPGNVALAIATLDKPLKIGDYHIAAVKTDKAKTIGAQFRVLPFFFMRTSWNWSPQSAQEVRDMHMNTVFKSGGYSLEKCREYGLYSDAGDHSRMRYHYFSDEPDGRDALPEFFEKFGRWQDEDPLYTGKAWAVGLGRIARRLVTQRTIERFEHTTPQAASYIIINGTTRPLNWAVYGQLTDIASTDPYSCNSYGGDHTVVREQFILLRHGSAPRPLHACLETYRGKRFPTPPEHRQNVVQALGLAVKGLHSWVAQASVGGWLGNKPLQAEVAALNALTEHIEEELLLAAPIDIVSNDAGLTQAGSHFFLEPGQYQLKKPWMKERVWTSALLCGPDAIVITAANHIPASKTAPETIDPAKDVTITVRLPRFLQNVQAFEATEHGVKPFSSCTIGKGKAVLKVEAIESGRVFLLRRQR